MTRLYTSYITSFEELTSFKKVTLPTVPHFMHLHAVSSKIPPGPYASPSSENGSLLTQGSHGVAANGALDEDRICKR